MVDGINITSPLLSGTGERQGAVPKPVDSDDRPKVQPAKETSQLRANETDNSTSAIAKSDEKRFTALTSGNDFLRAAERFINASLPSKPPGTKLRIDLDADSGRFVYQGVDINTGDVVTQFPSEQILKLIAFNRERDGIEGIVVDEEV
ncbi:MAG: hypothetical protein COB49_12020 [Alphaproteobacteria bacterium]|nr:MAG: hypothetical protein COB49_12020 [Alphaproteobacteria bacterium]